MRNGTTAGRVAGGSVQDRLSATNFLGSTDAYGQEQLSCVSRQSLVDLSQYNGYLNAFGSMKPANDEVLIENRSEWVY